MGKDFGHLGGRRVRPDCTCSSDVLCSEHVQSGAAALQAAEIAAGQRAGGIAIVGAAPARKHERQYNGDGGSDGKRSRTTEHAEHQRLQYLQSIRDQPQQQLPEDGDDSYGK